MSPWWWASRPEPDEEPAEARIRAKYRSFQELLSLNDEGLELLSRLQEDLRYIPPLRSIVGDRVAAIFDRAEAVASSLDRLCDERYAALHRVLGSLRREVETSIAAREELSAPRLAAWLSELDGRAAAEAGSKAAALAEVRNRVGLPVPDGFVLTTQAYRQFCGIPLWEVIRDETRSLDPEDLGALERCARWLRDRVLECPVPRAVEVAIIDRAEALGSGSFGLAVRSSGVGEGGGHSFAGQFETLLNVPLPDLVEAYKQVVASRFSARALCYRLSRGLLEVDCPMAVLFLPTIDAAAAGVLYSRNPADPRAGEVWIASTLGLGLDVAAGSVPADLFILSRKGRHAAIETEIVPKETAALPREGGGVWRRAVRGGEEAAPSLGPEYLRTLAAWAVRLERHFGAPQDVEWVLDRSGALLVLQTRNLATAAPERSGEPPGADVTPLLSGGRPVYPGRVSGRAHVVDGARALSDAPRGAIVFLRSPTPEIATVLPRLGGLVSGRGSLAGHSSTLLREERVPSVFQMPGVPGPVRNGETVSLDAVLARVYAGTLWPARPEGAEGPLGPAGARRDPTYQRVLALTLVDPDAFNFRPKGCRSVHDVLRFAHEKAVEAMFAVNDREMERGDVPSRKIETRIPLDLHVLDLGGGLSPDCPDGPTVDPDHIRSRPFKALWRGMAHPDVAWVRAAPPSLGGFASVLAASLSEHPGAKRALGDPSYLLVAGDYFNLNARLAYHFSLVDACVCDDAGRNYVVFRFAGGGAGRHRRSLRACFIQAVLERHGYHVDRRGDLVNAWSRKAPAPDLEEKLDVLGRLMACAGQLDMYMNSRQSMLWYVEQFLSGRYDFPPPPATTA